ncbi:YqhR family membrane protein [Paenibacillus sp. p3-SID867]|uniref:YqhR family membrane protein n=1 Tax=Paenibacillus sp. p3-SID867 TaxID=2916363 RepID=UPI0021A9081D|nr:YqhR family membrane protein [Paenibacillus sp. p3-SID867]MCT1397490.1 YqhR family membrane protein [Paenibacillus sp. p3-SID867]
MHEHQFRKQNQVTNPFTFALELGYYAGLIWGAVHWIFYWLKFTKVLPGFLLEPFFKHEFLATTAGQIAGWLSFIAFSVIASLIYVTLFRKLRGPWPGIAYGIVWWAVLFVALNPWLRLTDPVKKLPWDTNISEVCIFILWGLFIGYTTAQEFTDEKLREPKKVTG